MYVQFFTALSTALFFYLAVSVAVFAAAPVTELGAQPQRPATTSTPASIPAPIPAPTFTPTAIAVPTSSAIDSDSSSGGLLYQVQLLQDEVRTLRGMVEELNNDVRQMKQRQMDDYIDLDRRLSTAPSETLSRASEPSIDTRVPTASGPESDDTKVMSSSSGGNSVADAADYDKAYAQLKAGKTTAAISSFNALIEKYPQSQYAANSHYWLGEIYVLQNQLEQARQSFSAVLKDYPAHRKAPDSTFKLGQVYFLLGNKGKAKELLEKAASGNDNAARLARSYLEKNF